MRYLKYFSKMAKSLDISRSKKNRPFTVLIEGNIGCGKTTFLNHFKTFDNVCVLAEPIDMWRNVNGHNLLDLMYKDTEKWSFSFQSYVQLTMLKMHTMETKRPIKMMERSIFSCSPRGIKYDDKSQGAKITRCHGNTIKVNNYCLEKITIVLYNRTREIIGRTRFTSPRGIKYDDKSQGAKITRCHGNTIKVNNYCLEKITIVLYNRTREKIGRTRFTRYCFIEKMTKDGKMSGPSYAVLNEYFKFIYSNIDIPVDLIVYLRSDPDVVYKRMLYRNRSEEKCVPLEYIRDLHKYHEDWLYNRTAFSVPAPIITLNADLDITLIKEEYDRFEECMLSKVMAEV